MGRKKKNRTQTPPPRPAAPPPELKVVGRVQGSGSVPTKQGGPPTSVHVGRPTKMSVRTKVATFAGGFGSGSGVITGGANGQYYSPELSPDFLELPQTREEQLNFYRFFYRHEPYVGAAVDQHVNVPLSKIRLRKPEAKDPNVAKAALTFCEDWANRVGLLQRLLEILHDYTLFGECSVFLSDDTPEMPEDVTHVMINEVTSNGDLRTIKKEREDAAERQIEWLRKNYKGWGRIIVLPPEQVKVESFPYTSEQLITVLPSDRINKLMAAATGGDPGSQRVLDSIPMALLEGSMNGTPLNTDPYAGSFVYVLARKGSQYEERGTSILQRCLRTLVFRDKVRQALTSMASRHMTPFRLVWAEGINPEQMAALREQVDLVLSDPDYSIITNYQVNWEEQGVSDRLPDLSWVWDSTNSQLYAGLGVTEGLLTGESSYGGERLNLEVINTRYLLLRENLQQLVEEYFFAPMCSRMGFVELDDKGEVTKVIYPKLSFTRLALRDTADTFDALNNLYLKGSLSVDYILDLFNIDPGAVAEKLKRDLFTVNDPIFNEVLRGIYGKVGDLVVDGTNVTERIAKELGMSYKPPAAEGERF